MSKALKIAILMAGLPLLLGINEAAAGGPAPPGSGYCPTGTCGSRGGRYADDLKNCKKENCPGQQSRQR
jgi:hypothetical protein